MTIHDIKFVARGRLHWEEWKLGDSILACSVLERFEKVRLHVENISTEGNKLLEELSKNIFSDSYDFEMVPECAGVYKTISPDQFYLENNIQTVKPNKYIIYIPMKNKPYITSQFKSNNNRTINEDLLQTHIDKQYEFLDLSDSKNNFSLSDVFNLVGNAEKHIGAASGICWVAMSTRTPTTILMPKSFRRGGWDYALECMYRSSVITILDV